MHPVLDCDLARLRHTGLRVTGPGHTGHRPDLPPLRPAASRWSTELAALLLRRSIAVAEHRAARLERDTTRLVATLAEVEARARATRARLA